MTNHDDRHYTEEELLMHAIGEQTEGLRAAMENHLASCRECSGVFEEYRELLTGVREWQVPQLTELSWEQQKLALLTAFRKDQNVIREQRPFRSLGRLLASVWDYALENPLPSVGYVAAAVAFASERTITVFRLDRILPATGEVFAFLRQVL